MGIVVSLFLQVVRWILLGRPKEPLLDSSHNARGEERDRHNELR